MAAPPLPGRPGAGAPRRRRSRFTIGRRIVKLGPKIATTPRVGETRKEHIPMFGFASAIAVTLLGLGDEAGRIEPGHSHNPVYAEVLGEGLKADGTTFKLPEPRLRDGQAAEAQRAALREVAGSDQRLDEL